MSIESPSPSEPPSVTPYLLENGITLFAKSECNYCKKAKALLIDWEIDAHIIYCDTLLQSDRIGFLKNIHKTSGKPENTIKTFPIIFFNHEYIGGYTELQKIYEKLFKKNVNNTDFLNSNF